MRHDGFFGGCCLSTIGTLLDLHHLSKRTVGLIEEETVVKITDCPKFRIICRFGIVFGCQEYLIIENHRDYIDETGVSICKIPFLTTVRIDGEYAGFIDTNCGFVVLLVVSYGKINRTVRIYRRCAGTACLGTVVAELIRIVDIAVNIADLILPEGVVVSTRDKEGTEEKMTIDAEHYEFPMAVLVNEYSASASEILAGAIRDYHAGILVGTKTFGKGVIQAELQFTDGTGMKVTVARYYTPNGECIHEVGIEPDVDIELNKEAVTKYGYNNLPHDQDNQLQTAVRILTGESTLEAEKEVAEAIKAEKKAGRHHQGISFRAPSRAARPRARFHP